MIESYKKQYLEVLWERYLRARAKKEKTQILDEYCRSTSQAREYVIRNIQPGVELRPKPRKKRKQTYDGQVTAPLAKVWEIFDCPCGQRLKPIDVLYRTYEEKRKSEQIDPMRRVVPHTVTSFMIQQPDKARAESRQEANSNPYLTPQIHFSGVQLWHRVTSIPLCATYCRAAPLFYCRLGT